MAAHRLANIAMRTKMWPFIIVLSLVPALLGQADIPIQGTVTSQDGQPIEGVTVYGQGKQTTTDKAGAFRVQHPGAVLHFYKENLQPQLVVIQPGSSALRITMSPVTNPMDVPSCGRLQLGQKRVGWGQYGPQFTVSERSLDVQGGKPDADFVRYVIRRKQGRSFLDLWFGVISVEPDDDQFMESIHFAQRLLLYRNNTRGLDSRGHLRGGGSWRHTVIASDGGAVYTKASTDDAIAFDQVIDSMCYVPYPSK